MSLESLTPNSLPIKNILFQLKEGKIVGFRLTESEITHRFTDPTEIRRDITVAVNREPYHGEYGVTTVSVKVTTNPFDKEEIRRGHVISTVTQEAFVRIPHSRDDPHKLRNL